MKLLGGHAEADICCRAASVLEPVRHNTHKNLGLALEGQGQFLVADTALGVACRERGFRPGPVGSA